MERVAGRQAAVQPRLPVTYHSLTVPARLLTDLSDSPLAIGVYGLVARLFLIEQQPVPLSTGDVRRYDPTLSRSAIVRAFTRLVRGGWLIEQTKPGRKTCYTPAWGVVSGSPRAWRIGATLLDRPRRIQVVLLNKRLLDTCIGKLVPHGTNPALIERYLTHPLLYLADIGVYLLLDNGGRVVIPERLTRLGLVRDNHTVPLPSDPCLLALASQRALFDTPQSIELTKKGLLRLGCPPVDESKDGSVRERPLFFVSPAMFGSMTVGMDSNMTGSVSQNREQFTRSECAQLLHADAIRSITWIKEDQGNKGNTTPLPPTNLIGGGHVHPARRGAKRAQPCSHISAAYDEIHQGYATSDESETVNLLRSLNICPTVIAELADQPLDRVQAAITDGRTRPGVRDLGGWVVALVRLGRDHGWNMPPPPPRADSPEALREAFARYAAQQEAERMGDRRVDDPELPTALAVPGPVETLVRVWNEVQDAVRMQISRREFTTWLRPARLCAVRDGIAVIAVPDARIKAGVESHVLAAMRDQLSACVGAPIMVRIIIDGTPHEGADVGACPGGVLPPTSGDMLPAASQAIDGRPSWIGAEQWQTLPGMLRAVLHGAQLEGGQLMGVSPHMTYLLQTRYADDVAALLGRAGQA